MCNNQSIGVVVTDFDEADGATSSVFKPASYTRKIKVSEPNEADPVVRVALQTLASYFVHVGNIEEHDPDLTRIAHRVLVCEKYSNGKPKHCEVEFYLEPVV